MFVKLVAALILSIVSLSAAEPTVLRVFCWNIHHGVGEDGKRDLDRIAKVIRDAKPDLVALQEVDQNCARSGKIDQTAELAKLTGMTGVFGKAMDFDGGAYGQAILSRLPIESSKVHALPGKGEPRIGFEAIVLNKSFKLSFTSIHLDLDAAQRLAQAREIVSKLEKQTHPAILCGDFNDTPDSPTIHTIAVQWKPIPKAAPTLTQPAGKPETEIDFVFTRGLDPVAPLKVIPETVASDHRPMVVDLKFTAQDSP